MRLLLLYLHLWLQHKIDGPIKSLLLLIGKNSACVPVLHVNALSGTEHKGLRKIIKWLEINGAPEEKIIEFFLNLVIVRHYSTTLILGLCLHVLTEWDDSGRGLIVGGGGGWHVV